MAERMQFLECIFEIYIRPLLANDSEAINLRALNALPWIKTMVV